MLTYRNPIEFREKWEKYQDYIGALEEERKKIQVFERELPLCLELVTQAIERCRVQQVSGTIADSFNGQSNDEYNSKQISNDYPVLEEYIPIKPTSSTTDKEDKQHDHELFSKSKIGCGKDWLTSTQLSIQTPDPPIEVDLSKNKNTSDTSLTIGVDQRCPAMVSSAAISSSADTDFGGSDGGGGTGDGGGDKGFIRFNKKERRCWSPELHRRFLHALQQLGGAHVATPKQIKESMKVDGLTNDEIKSHLQKYRLHTRRSNPPLHNDVHTPHQLVLVGQIWMPPLEYVNKTASSPLTDTNNNSKAIYTPIASLPPSIATSLYKTNQYKQQPS